MYNGSNSVFLKPLIRRDDEMKLVLINCVVAACLSVSCLAGTGPEQPVSRKPLIGQKERVILLAATGEDAQQKHCIAYIARVDTGAATCSIHARQITREGDRVRFTIYSDDRKTAYPMTADIMETTLITTGEGSEERVKVQLCFRIGDRPPIRAAVTLNDRSQLQHGLLLGRNVLEGYWVDINRGADLAVPQR